MIMNMSTHVIDSIHAAELLMRGSVGVLPTDTVYGVVARAQDAQAVERLYKLKHREHKPGTIVAASLAQLAALGLDMQSVQQVANFWPGPISVIVPVISPDLEYLHQGLGSLAVRVPDMLALQRTLEQTGPLLTSSANHPGEPVAHTVDEAMNYFGDAVDFYVDGGDLSAQQPSTIVRVRSGEIELIRQGVVVLG